MQRTPQIATGSSLVPGTERRLFRETRRPKYGTILSRLAPVVEVSGKLEIARFTYSNNPSRGVPNQSGIPLQDPAVSSRVRAALFEGKRLCGAYVLESRSGPGICSRSTEP